MAPALIDRLDVLRSLFKAISVPETVHALPDQSPPPSTPDVPGSTAKTHSMADTSGD
jgi:hypothetical protein